MADKTIAELSAGTGPLAGTETFHGVQAGNSRRFTTDQLRGMAPGTTAALVAGDILYVDSNEELVRLPKGFNGQALRIDNGLPTWGPIAPRAWHAAKTSVASTASTTWVDTGLSIAVQPSRADVSLKVEAHLNGVGGGSSTNTVQFRLVRDSSVPVSAVGDLAGSRTQTSTELPSNQAVGGATTAHTSLVAVDTPGDAIQHYYKVQWRISDGTAFLNRSSNDSNGIVYSRSASTITVTEVALQ